MLLGRCRDVVLTAVLSLIGISLIAGYSSAQTSVCITSSYCYTIWKLKEPMTKWESLMFCEKKNQTLAIIPSKTHELKLARQLTGDDDLAWVGLNLALSTGWKWLKKDGYIDAESTLNINDERKRACLIINRDELFSSACGRPLSYICEFSKEGIDADAVNISNKWIRIHTTPPLSWMNAARNCSGENGNLLAVEDNSMLKQIRTHLSSTSSSHFWSGATRVPLIWDDPDVANYNPYRLIWSKNISSNPNLDEAWLNNAVQWCVALSNRQRGLLHKRCTDRLTRAICSTKKPTPDSGSTVENRPTPTQGASNTSITESAVDECTGSCKDKYMAAVICAYILAVLLLIAIIILVVIFVRRRKRKRNPKYYDSAYNRKTYRTLGNGTLGRQRSTDPTEEWERIITENEEPMVQMRSSDQDIDIIHNVPLDPRASLEQPLTIPRESQVVTLQRAKSRDSQNSLVSSEVATFTIDRRTNSTNSILKVPPPVPPKTRACAGTKSLATADINEPSSDFPPPPPPSELMSHEPPPVPLKPGKRPPRRHRRKPLLPDPIYAQIDKSAKGATMGPQAGKGPPPRLNISVPADNSDSGVDMGVSSPSHPSPEQAPGTLDLDATAQIAYLDSVLNQMSSPQ